MQINFASSIFGLFQRKKPNHRLEKLQTKKTARRRRQWRRWRRRRRIVSDLCLLNNWEESTETILTLYAYVVVCMRVFIFDCCFFLFCASNEKYRTMSNNSHLFKLSSLQFFQLLSILLQIVFPFHSLSLSISMTLSLSLPLCHLLVNINSICFLALFLFRFFVHLLNYLLLLLLVLLWF